MPIEPVSTFAEAPGGLREVRFDQANSPAAGELMRYALAGLTAVGAIGLLVSVMTADAGGTAANAGGVWADAGAAR